LKVCVVGLGRAGLPLAAVMAESGLEVYGYDIDSSRVKTINAGENPIPDEPGLQELIKAHAGVNLKAVSDIQKASECKAYIIVVPLFLNEDKDPDFTAIDSALETVSSVLEKGDVVVLETTVPPLTTRNRVKKKLEEESGYKAGADFYLAYSPERIMTGYSISRFQEFPKVIGGLDPESTNRAFELYQRFSNAEKVGNCRTAELVKVSEGVYRDVNIALANELYRVCENIDVDFWEMRESASHEYCDIHKPGLVGGHCIPIYPWFLIKEHDVPLTQTGRQLNEEMIEYYVDKIKDVTVNDKIGLIGLSYRSGVTETHFTKAHDLIKKLKDQDYTVYGADPMFSEEQIREEFEVEPLTELEEMGAVILMHSSGEYDEKLESIKEKVVDVKGVLD